jgi:hypothetical protein
MELRFFRLVDGMFYKTASFRRGGGGQKQKNEGFLFLTLDMLWSGS